MVAEHTGVHACGSSVCDHDRHVGANAFEVCQVLDIYQLCLLLDSNGAKGTTDEIRNRVSVPEAQFLA